MKLSQDLEKDIIDLKVSIHGNFISQGIAAACELEVFDNFDDIENGLTSEELAKRSNANHYSFKKLLKFLVTQKLLSLDSDLNTYKITPKGMILRKDNTPSMHYFARMHGTSLFRKASDFLVDSVKDNNSGTSYFCEDGMFSYLNSHPKDSLIFNQAMKDLTHVNSVGIANYMSQIGKKTIVDAGGGVGTLLCAILKANPQSTGIIWDLPNLKREALTHIKNSDLASRASFVEGSFFDELHLLTDVVMLHHVLHDYNDDLCISILNNCIKALTESGSIFIIETLLGDNAAIGAGWLKDLIMHTITLGGRVRHLQDFMSIFEKCNLRVVKIHKLDQETSDISIIELQVDK